MTHSLGICRLELRPRRAGAAARTALVGLAAGALLALPPAWARSQAVDGFTEPWRIVDVAAREAGLVATIEVREGQTVVEGELLATLDQEALLATRELARVRQQHHAGLDLARAELELRRRRLDKLRELDRAGHARPDEVERAIADQAIAAAQLLAAEEEHELAALEFQRIEMLVRQREIRAPLGGVIVKVEHDPGEFVAIHEPRMFQLVFLGSLRVRFSLPPPAAAQVRRGQTVRLQIPDRQTNVSGTVDYVAPVAEADSGTVRVDVRLNNSAGELTAGLRCQWNLTDPNATIELSVREPAEPAANANPETAAP